MRLLSLSALAALVAVAAVEACSLFIPFDEYPGPSLTADGSPPPVPSDGGEGGADADGPDPCARTNLMTDPLNCAVCGRRCANDGGCDKGRCPIEVVAEASAITSLTLAPGIPDAGDYLYVTLGGTLGRYLLDNSPLPLQIETAPGAGVTGASAVNHVGTAGVVITSAGLSNFGRNTFVDAGLDAWATATGNVKAVIVENNNNRAFWSDRDGLWWNSPITRNNGNGGRQGTDAGGAPLAFASFQDDLYWMTEHDIYQISENSPGSPALFMSYPTQTLISIAASARRVQVGLHSQGVQILNVDANQRGAELRRLDLGNAVALRTSGTFLYILNVEDGKPGRLWRSETDGTTLVTLVDTVPKAVASLAVDDTFVYFSDGSNILRTTK
jgi:hypothetical protein